MGSLAQSWFDEGPGMLPLPQFTSGAEVLIRGSEVLPPTAFPVPTWETADQSTAYGLGVLRPNPALSITVIF